MCGAVSEPGQQVRHHPDAGGLVCSVCGQPEEPDGILAQVLGPERPAGDDGLA
jgi:hypothetical protein